VREDGSDISFARKRQAKSRGADEFGEALKATSDGLTPEGSVGKKSFERQTIPLMEWKSLGTRPLLSLEHLHVAETKEKHRTKAGKYGRRKSRGEEGRALELEGAGVASRGKKP